jgi:hypothetical protein
LESVYLSGAGGRSPQGPAARTAAPEAAHRSGQGPCRHSPSRARGPLDTAGRGLLAAAAETLWRAETQPGRRSPCPRPRRRGPIGARRRRRAGRGQPDRAGGGGGDVVEGGDIQPGRRSPCPQLRRRRGPIGVRRCHRAGRGQPARAGGGGDVVEGGDATRAAQWWWWGWPCLRRRLGRIGWRRRPRAPWARSPRRAGGRLRPPQQVKKPAIKSEEDRIARKGKGTLHPFVS